MANTALAIAGSAHSWTYGEKNWTFGHSFSQQEYGYMGNQFEAYMHINFGRSDIFPPNAWKPGGKAETKRKKAIVIAEIMLAYMTRLLSDFTLSRRL